MLNKFYTLLKLHTQMRKDDTNNNDWLALFLMMLVLSDSFPSERILNMTKVYNIDGYGIIT